MLCFILKDSWYEEEVAAEHNRSLIGWVRWLTGGEGSVSVIWSCFNCLKSLDWRTAWVSVSTFDSTDCVRTFSTRFRAAGDISTWCVGLFNEETRKIVQTARSAVSLRVNPNPPPSPHVQRHRRARDRSAPQTQPRTLLEGTDRLLVQSHGWLPRLQNTSQ